MCYPRYVTIATTKSRIDGGNNIKSRESCRTRGVKTSYRFVSGTRTDGNSFSSTKAVDANRTTSASVYHSFAAFQDKKAVPTSAISDKNHIGPTRYAKTFRCTPLTGLASFLTRRSTAPTSRNGTSITGRTRCRSDDAMHVTTATHNESRKVAYTTSGTRADICL